MHTMPRSPGFRQITPRLQGPWATLAVLLPMLVAAGGALAGNVYKSVGPDGRVVYSDVPPASGKVEKTLQLESAPASPLPAIYREALRRVRAESAATAEPTAGVVFYAAAWCGYCRQARAYMSAKGIAYREIDIDSNDGMVAFARVGGQGVPLLVAAGKRLQGFSVGSYDGFFKKRQGQ
jgi:glutaredoxin